MKQYKKLTPEGTRDFLFEESATREQVEQQLATTFKAHGYHEVKTPGLEFYDVFNTPASEIPQEALYKLTDKRGRLLVMRPDSTVPIARVVSTRLKNQLLPIRLYYAQPIFCNTPGLDGRNDEIMQSGIELIGASGMRADLEVIVTAVEALSKCAPDFRIEIGHAGFFKALAAKLDVDESTKEEIRLSIESKNYPLLDNILDKLEPCEAVDAIRMLPRLFGGEEIFDEAAEYCFDDKTTETLAYLKKLYDNLCQLNLGHKIMIDLGLVQRNDYYTDIVFSAYVENFGNAVLTGGRYDNLFSEFDMPTPAIGFAVNIDAITSVQLQLGKGAVIPKLDYLVHGDEGKEVKALQFMSQLVSEGKCCESSVFETREEAEKYAVENNISNIVYVSDKVEIIPLISGGM